MAVCATPTSSAGHALAGAKTNPKLTFLVDYLSGAGHFLRGNPLIRSFEHGIGNVRIHSLLTSGNSFLLTLRETSLPSRVLFEKYSSG
jgi:hypothetical protein